jgi:hypothetical protein
MQHQYLENVRQTSTTESERLRGMIADLSRRVLLLDSDVAAEEERYGVYDRSDAGYPMLARIIAARSENLKVTITTLEERLISAVTVKATEVRKVAGSGLRRPRRNALPRRFEMWLRLSSSRGANSVHVAKSAPDNTELASGFD